MLSAKTGYCPSGPIASSSWQQWVLADGRLAATFTIPEDRYGTIKEAHLSTWTRDGSRVCVFDGPVRDRPVAEVERWLRERGAKELPNWVRNHTWTNGWSPDKAFLGAMISAWYDLHGIDMPPKEETMAERWIRLDREQLEKIQRSTRPSNRIVGGTRRRRNARRRANR
ncbi:MAG: hypothetical protein E6Q97_26945 [Desulfurellales bacterium]|nr:MAG: hypothetical protein E6Q97_26945 [Desulfurellales bacterium]